MIIKKTALLLILLFSITSLIAQNSWEQTSILTNGNETVFDIVTGHTGTVIASNWQNGVYRTTNDGDTWVFTGLSGERVYDLATVPNGNFFAFTTSTSGHSIHRSTNDGVTWNEVYNAVHQNNFASGGGIVFSDSIAVAALSFTLGPTIGNIGVDIVRSTDFGATWQFVSLLNGWGFANDVTLLNDGRILAATSLNGISYSTNMGSSWQAVTSFPPVYTAKVTSDLSGNIYIGRNSAGSNEDLMFKSTDGGNSWTGVGIMTNLNGGNLKSVHIDENNVIYVAAVLYGPTHYTIYRSSDNGATWDEYYDGIPSSLIVNSLTGKNNIIFAGTAGSGVYKRIIAPVPVELNSLTVSVIENTVRLQWQTATETNNMGFDVERKTITSHSSITEKWLKLGFVQGYGTSTETHSYSFKDENMEPGIYSYRLKQLDFNGNFEYLPSGSGEVTARVNLPGRFSLEQNYPNPFNPATNIRYSIKEKGFVSLKIYDQLGREVSSLVNEIKSPGTYEIQFLNASLPSGVYFYTLDVNSFSETRSMILLK